MEEKLKEVMAAVFGVAKDSIQDDASPETIASWDSLRHMNLIVAIEDAFDVEFTEEDIPQLLRFDKTLELIHERRNT